MARKRTDKRRRRARRDPRWTEEHVRRLFWRAGFGATPKEADLWARRGRDKALEWVLDGRGAAKLKGPPPSSDGRPLDPANEFGDAVLWWLDRMVRTTRPLEEKMTLFWHDHFATRDQDEPLMLRQNQLFRTHALSSFRSLLTAITLDPAMQEFLSLLGSRKEAPNENYARELMELFTLGAGYTETDIQEAARALTGFRGREDGGGLLQSVYIDKTRQDQGTKTIFGKSGNYDWAGVLDLVLREKRHPRFLVEKLWDYFIPTPIGRRTRRELAELYTKRGLRIKPVVRRILAHPDLYRDLDHPELVKSPVVYVAGLIRATGAPVDRRNWTGLLTSMGQRPFQPPSVAGWDWGPAWMSTNAMRTRFVAVNELLRDGGPLAVPDGSIPRGWTPRQHLALARRETGRPYTHPRTEKALLGMARRFLVAPAQNDEERKAHAVSAQRALRHLLLSGPDNQLH